MRLIDADVLMEKIVEYDNQNIQSPNRGTIVDVIDIISEMITELPTAYDPDFVAKKLITKCEADKKFCRTNPNTFFEGRISAFDIAVYLVAKGGVSDETCKG